MAELNNNAQSGTKKIRSRKLNSRVDLTAMVDLAFLLITFFMLTTTLSKPKSMPLMMPDQKGEPSKVDQNRTLTVLIGKENKAKCFMGKEYNQSKEVNLATNDLRREIVSCKKDVLAYTKGDTKKGLIVLIKPGQESEYGNLVDVLDEMAISQVQTYAIVDIDKSE